MRITAGMGSLDDYIAYVRAGADEVFCGYVPEWWMQENGNLVPMNRREVRFYNVQIGSESEMRILHAMQETYQVPVSIALNGLYYLPEQYPLLARYVHHCLELGFDRFILADLALLVYLHGQGLENNCHFQISGEIGEVNSAMIGLCRELGAERIIFHRKVSLPDMAECTRKIPQAKKGTPMEYEAFLMNEMCHFHGGYCNTLHCDELTHMCLVPYRAGKYAEEKTIEMQQPENALDERNKGRKYDDPGEIPGMTGCGLCALPELKKAGVTDLKIVGRGNYTAYMLRDISTVKKALQILADAKNPEQYRREMKQMLFPAGCSGNCYYRSELYNQD